MSDDQALRLVKEKAEEETTAIMNRRCEEVEQGLRDNGVIAADATREEIREARANKMVRTTMR